MIKILAYVAVVAMIIALYVGLVEWQNGDCAHRGGERVSTSGLQYVCVDPEGRIIP